MSAGQAAGAAIHAYRWLARGFPEEFQRAHGNELVALSEDLIQHVAARQGWRGFLPFVAGMFGDLIMRLIAELSAEFWLNVKYALRTLRKSPGFAAVSILSLGMGIGMGTSVYSQLESTVFREVPRVAEPKGLVRFQRPAGYPDYEDYRDHSGQFATLAAYLAPVPFVVNWGAGPERAWGHLVTADYFATLGVAPYLGRLIGPEDKPGGLPVAVLSHRYWRDKLGARRDIAGSSIRINGQAVTVIGVGPPDFLGASPMMAAADLFLPTSIQTRVAPELGSGALTDRRVAAFQLFGRLRPGVKVSEAENALDTMARNLEQQRNDPGKDHKGRRVTLLPGGRLIPVRDEDLPTVTAFPAILVGLMLWIASANVATMLLARALARRKEIAVRLAIGAGRGRILRQLLTESMLLAIAGGAVGLLFAYWSNSTTEWFRPIIPNYMDLQLRISWTAAGVTFLLSALTGILFGLAPALAATRSDIASALKSGGATRGFRWFSTRNILVLQQVAGSLALLLMTGFIILGFQRTANVDVGFDTSNLYTMSLDPVRDGYSAEQARDFFDKLPAKVREIDGIVAATLTQSAPLNLFGGQSIVATKQDFLDEAAGTRVKPTRIEHVGSGYFETIGIPLVAGRGFQTPDERGEARVVVVNENMARNFWPNTTAVGQTVDLQGKRYEVVGVARNVRSTFVIDEGANGAYLPVAQSAYATPSAQGVTLMVRSRPGIDVITAVRRLVSSQDANVTVFHADSIENQVRNLLLLVKITTVLYGAIGLFGLLLAAIGLAGVTAYAVVQRTKEIGIRMALGARRLDVVRLVMREGTWMVAVGTVFGFAAAYALVQTASTYLSALSQVLQTSMTDPLLLIGAPLLLAGLALAACYWPARRSTRIDPLAALREE
ncbi:MAG: ABC transporter permease [Bryobacteraceae bacterium]|nr:ABC transporter permease [Bryobacteraceae bacterium]